MIGVSLKVCGTWTHRTVRVSYRGQLIGRVRQLRRMYDRDTFKLTPHKRHSAKWIAYGQGAKSEHARRGDAIRALVKRFRERAS